MSWTQTDLEAIERAIAKGELRVQYSDRSVEYRSIDELLKAREALAAAISAAASNPGVRSTLASFSKG